MIEKLDGSHDNVLGFRVSGDVTAQDYEVLVPAAEEVVGRSGTLRLLLDLRDLRWEKAEAWGADLKFGREFRHSIDRLAMVGDHTWEKVMAKVAAPLGYAQEIRYFEDETAAWAWLNDAA